MRLIVYKETCRKLRLLLEARQTYFHAGTIMMTAQYQAALHSYAEGRYEEAMQQFSELLHEDPRNPKLHIWLGATFRKAGKIEYAKTQYQQVLTLTDDPDLLDLASTSLAQIQNKLANIPQNTAPQKGSKNPQKNLGAINGAKHKSVNHDADKLQAANYRALQLGVANTGSKANSTTRNENIAYFVDHVDSQSDDDATIIKTSSINIPSKLKVTKPPQNNGNGIVPPPPAIAALFKNQQQDREDLLQNPSDEQPMMVGDEGNIIIDDLAVTENAPLTSILNDTIANIQETTKTTKTTRKGKRDQTQVKSPPVESVFLGMDDRNNPYYSRRKLKKQQDKSIALEDVFKFSSVSQKITLWGALVATIPAIALGVAAYQVGDGLLLNRVKQGQQLEAIALANATKFFVEQQSDDVEVLQKLLVSTEVGQNTLLKLPILNPSANNKATNPLDSLPIAQQRLYKQQLTTRLNLYSQAYPEYASIAIFSTNGELLAQSSKSKNLQTINPNILAKAGAVDNVLFSNPIVRPDETSFYAVRSIKSSVSQKVSMVLQVEIPVKSLVNALSNVRLNDGIESRNFYVIDSSNKYIASSQTVAVGEDALTNFAILPDMRTSQSANPSDLIKSDLVKSDRNGQMLAYAPGPSVQTYDMLTWDILTSVDKAKVIASNQNLLLVIGLGIAATPLLVAMLAYALSRKLSSRLKDIQAALRDLRQGNADANFGVLSVEGNDELSDISLSINKMSEQFQTMILKQEQEKQNLQLQVVKLFKVLAKLAREEKHEVQDKDLTDDNILYLGKKVRAEMVQRSAEVESYRQQKEEFQGQLLQTLKEMHALADGDLTVSTLKISAGAVDGDLANVATFFDDVMRGLQNVVGQVKSSANQVNFSLGQNEQAIANLASVSQRQVDTVTRSLNTMQMSKLSATKIVNNSQQVLQSSQLVVEKLSDSDRSIDTVMSKIEELQNTVAKTAKRVKHLGVVSAKISKAISSINEIAIKTNFLAINATLEASRSNDVSSGFVMVAEEVGELAARSVVATKEVENLLNNIQSETNAVMAEIESGSTQLVESNTLAVEAKDSLQQISQISQQIDGLMTAIAEATTSQVQTSEGVANLMNDISHMAKRTLASSSEASKFIKATRGYSGELQQSLTHFKTR
jgi:methyl-accepting chemotaxis protein PixJ